MVKTSGQVRVAVNVMRSRLTVIGFNITIVTFMVVLLDNIAGGIVVPGESNPVHVGASMALFMGLALSFLSMLVFIMSSAFDETGFCTHWSLVAGDLLMYLALAQTIAGFFGPLTNSINIFSAELPGLASDISILHGAPLVVGGLAWFFATYLGPVVALVRSPFPLKTNIALGLAYVISVVTLAWVSSHAVRVEDAVSGDGQRVIFNVLMELFQPFRW